MFRLLLLPLFFVSFYGVCKVSSEQIKKLDALFAPTVAADTVPGINIAIADSNGIVWAQAYGLADSENNVAMTPAHKMRVGSIAKLITVAAMMRLVEQGKLSLDTPITKYVADWPTTHKPITLRQLAAHTAGIRSYHDDAEFILNQYFATTQASLGLFKDDALLFEPGTAHLYSTFAFTLIAAAMEGADKKRSFKQIIQQQVFAPLSMQDTVFDDQAEIIPKRQRPYVVREGKLFNAPQSDHSYKYAGGGFIATPSDISRFAVAHGQAGYLTQTSLDDMFTQARLKNGNTLPFGIGWMVDFDNYKNRSYYQGNLKVQDLMASFDNAVMHSGGSNGGTTMLILCREHQRSVTVVKNVDGEYSADVFLLALQALSMFHNDASAASQSNSQ